MLNEIFIKLLALNRIQHEIDQPKLAKLFSRLDTYLNAQK